MTRLQRSRGLTLVELLVGMSMGLVIVGAMAALYVRTSQSSRQLEALARLQENARYAFEIMGYDIRMAGNTGCYVPGQITPANFVNGGANHWWSHIGRPLSGQDETPDGNAAGDDKFPQVAPGNYGTNALRGDTLVVLRANAEDNAGNVGDYDLGEGSIPFSDPSGKGFRKGSLLLLSDCKTQTALFHKTGPADPAHTDPLEHAKVEPAASSPRNPGNCQAGLSGTCATASGTPSMAGARVLPLSANAYYLRASPYKYPRSDQYIPSLYRQVLGTSAGELATTAEELVSGVTDLQFRYGVGTINADGRSEITSYLDAGSVTDWSKVLAVRVSITLESTDDNLRNDSQSIKLGNGVTLTDRRLRRSYTTTFGIRNRLVTAP